MILKTMQFKIHIMAPRERIWEVLWSDDTYNKWTSVFTEGSRAESDWQEGSRITFLDGKGNGMFSEIHRMIRNQQMTFRHLGEIKDGKENLKSEWGDMKESYYLKDDGGQTDLTIELDMPEEFEKYFTDVFPRALQLVKALAEEV